MAGNYPGGVAQADIDYAAGGYDPPPCECVYNSATDTQDSEDCLLHGSRGSAETTANLAAAPGPIAFEPLLGNFLSPTQVRAFLDCSARWWFKYGLHLPEPKTGNLALGIAVHQALEVDFREKLETK
jgi:PD-(D/E)XK nuclease superfamily